MSLLPAYLSLRGIIDSDTEVLKVVVGLIKIILCNVDA